MRKKIYLPSVNHGLEEYDVVYNQQEILSYILSQKSAKIILPKDADILQKSVISKIHIEQDEFQENLVNAFLEEKVFLRYLYSDNFIKDYFYQFYDITIADYFKTYCYTSTFSFEKVVPHLNEETKRQLIHFLSMIDLEYQSYISLDEIKESIHRQIENLEKEKEKTIFDKYSLGTYEKIFLVYAKESYHEMYETSKQNQKVLHLKRK